MMTQLQALIDAGLDRSRPDEEDGTIDVRCSQCEALVINGTATHERGCPNAQRKRRYYDEEDWDEGE